MMRNIYALSLSAFIFAGCSLSPELNIPTTQFPQAYRSDVKSEISYGNAVWLPVQLKCLQLQIIRQ